MLLRRKRDVYPTPEIPPVWRTPESLAVTVNYLPCCRAERLGWQHGWHLEPIPGCATASVSTDSGDWVMWDVWCSGGQLVLQKKLHEDSTFLHLETLISELLVALQIFLWTTSLSMHCLMRHSSALSCSWIHSVFNVLNSVNLGGILLPEVSKLEKYFGRCLWLFTSQNQTIYPMSYIQDMAGSCS